MALLVLKHHQDAHLYSALQLKTLLTKLVVNQYVCVVSVFTQCG